MNIILNDWVVMNIVKLPHFPRSDLLLVTSHFCWISYEPGGGLVTSSES